MKKIFLLYFVSIALLIAGCQPTTEVGQTQGTGKITIVTTLFPLYEFAKEVGGEKAEVTLLLPPGAEPHSFEPKPSDIQKIERADVFIYGGEVMEPWAHDILGGVKNDELKIIDSSSLVVLLENTHHAPDEPVGEHPEEDPAQHEEHEAEEEHPDKEHEAEEEHSGEDHHEHGSSDPHIWLDLENDRKIVDEIAKTLSRIDPANADHYTSNAERYIQQLQALDTRYLTELAGCKKDEFLVGGHNFFTYVEHRYGIDGISAIENLEPNTEPTPKRIKEIADIARDHDIRFILTEVLVSKRLSEAIAQEVGASVLTFNPAANLPKADLDKGVTFLTVMESNLDTLKMALECD